MPPLCRRSAPLLLLALAASPESARAARPTPSQKLKRKVITSSLLNISSSSDALEPVAVGNTMIMQADCGNICTKDNELFFGGAWTGILMARTDQESELERDKTGRVVPKWKGRLTCGQYSRILKKTQDDRQICLYDKVDDKKPEYAILQQTHPHIEENCCMEPSELETRVAALQESINKWDCTGHETCTISPWELRELVTEILVQVKDLKVNAVDLSTKDILDRETQAETSQIGTDTSDNVTTLQSLEVVPEKPAVVETELPPKKRAASIIRKYFQPNQLKALVTHLYEAIEWVMAKRKHKLGEIVEVFNKVEDVLNDPDHFQHQHQELTQFMWNARKHQTGERRQMHWMLKNIEGAGEKGASYSWAEALQDALFQPVQDGRLTAEQANYLVQKVAKKAFTSNRDPEDVLLNMMQHDTKTKMMMGASMDAEIYSTMKNALKTPPLDGVLKAVLGDNLQDLGVAFQECQAERDVECPDCKQRCDNIATQVTRAHASLEQTFYSDGDTKTPAMDKYLNKLERALKDLENKHREIMITARLFKMEGLD